MWPFKKKRFTLYPLGRVVAIVLVWRGIWYMLDSLDRLVFGGSHTWTSTLGVALGIAFLVLPEGDLEALERH